MAISLVLEPSRNTSPAHALLPEPSVCLEASWVFSFVAVWSSGHTPLPSPASTPCSCSYANLNVPGSSFLLLPSSFLTEAFASHLPWKHYLSLLGAGLLITVALPNSP